MPRGKPFKKGYDERRHLLTRENRQKGYRTLMQLVRTGKIPSRVAASIRRRMREQRQAGPRGQTVYDELAF